MDRNEVKNRLLKMCVENEIFKFSDLHASLTIDLVDYGMVDSMSLMTLQGLIDEEFNVEIATELIVIELRTIDDIINYIAKHT